MSPDGGGDPDAEGTVSWRELWRETERRVGDRRVARWICEVASGAAGDEFVDALDDPATERMVAHLDAMVARYADGEPLQYVLGRWAFRHLDVLVDRRVLIPRPETELLVDHALTALTALPAHPRPWRVADLGTGSGVIGLSIAHERWHDGMEVWLTDVSPDALDVASANAAGLGRAAVAVRAAQGSWYEALPASHRASFHAIVANPPYIAPDDPDVEPIVRDHEPHLALFAADAGLAHLARIVAGAGGWLVPGGTLLLEIGSGQGDAVTALARDAGLVEVEVHLDLAGLPRGVQAKRAAT
ncbi:MAG: peptide chain release factor N(5)-glutamine methyltransferase [Actinomycetes bacterium]